MTTPHNQIPVPSETPRTAANCVTFEMGVPILNCTEVVSAAFACMLERELAQAKLVAARWDMLRRRVEGNVTVRRRDTKPWTPWRWVDLEAYLDAEIADDQFGDTAVRRVAEQAAQIEQLKQQVARVQLLHTRLMEEADHRYLEAYGQTTKLQAVVDELVAAHDDDKTYQVHPVYGSRFMIGGEPTRIEAAWAAARAVKSPTVQDCAQDAQTAAG